MAHAQAWPGDQSDNDDGQDAPGGELCRGLLELLVSGVALGWRRGCEALSVLQSIVCQLGEPPEHDQQWQGLSPVRHSARSGRFSSK